MATPERPNVLLIMSDEHAPQYSSVYGHPVVVRRQRASSAARARHCPATGRPAELLTELPCLGLLPRWASTHPAASLAPSPQQTPNMERLASLGATFESAYCNSPLCLPSRMSFMTGRFGSNVASYDNVS